MKIFGLLLFLSLNSCWAIAGESVVEILTGCFPSSDLKKEITNEHSLRKGLQRNDFRLRVLGGFSNNEISQNNPERVQVGVNLRWEDILDNQNRKEFHQLTGDKKEQETKYVLENYWRFKMRDYYFWKWGKGLRTESNLLLQYVQTKLSAGEESFSSLVSTQFYSDLLELNRLTSEFKSKIDSLGEEYSKCQGLLKWEEELDFSRTEIEKSAAKKSKRNENFLKSCQIQKRMKSISLEREAGAWGVALNTSFTRNKLLSGDGGQFNDIRAGVEVTIPISDLKSEKIAIDSCDYEMKHLENEERSEKEYSKNMYPLLETLQKQFGEVRKKLSSVSNDNFSGVPTRDVIHLGLNILNLHTTLASGESKMNSVILPEKIVENEL